MAFGSLRQVHIFYVVHFRVCLLFNVHWADNKGAISNQQHLNFRPCVVSGDIWDERKHCVALSLGFFIL